MSVATVTRQGILDIQVCVPETWTDEEVVQFATGRVPCDGGWSIRKEGSKFLQGDPERTPCDKRPGFVHIMLDA